ncbi:MAG: lysophospholipid acyltransferase family protein [Burkholderiaceae bacterium]
MQIFRILWRLCLLLPLIVVGLVSVGLLYPLASQARREWMNRLWSRALLRICGLSVSVSGQALMSGPVLFVANHVSWIDIFVMNAVRPTAFIAKSEIRRWPIVGWLVAGAGTVFIERGQRRAVHGVSLAMRERFDRGAAVGLYPEGTTSDGLGLLPLHAGLFEPARFAGAPIQPLALIYARQGDRRQFPAFVGEETLVRNVCRILGARGLTVRAHYMAPVGQVDDTLDPTLLGRVAIAASVRDAISQALQSPPGERA